MRRTDAHYQIHDGVGRGDFADYVIREHSREAGCRSVATFDRALLKEDGFERP